MNKFKPGQVSLERALSKLGIASRTQSREWIREGRVQVNGAAVKDPGFRLNPERAKIEIDQKRVVRASARSFILYKPRGTVTTRSDEKGRPTVFSLVEELGLYLIAVGRLDWATSGLLILTNDTRLSDRLTDPKNEIPRTYLVTVRGNVTEDEASRIQQGIRHDGDLLQVSALEIQKTSNRESHLKVELMEGKNREIRRMFLAIGHEVTRLKRVSFGDLTLGDLQPGEYRELSAKELEALFPSVKSE